MLKFALLVAVAVVVPSLGAHLPHIIGGNDVTDPARWPWQCSLWALRASNRWSYTCGASLIGRTWVVTAGHCVGGNASRRRVRCGSVHRNASGEIRHGLETIIHENKTKGEGRGYDIAVIKIEDLMESDTIKYVPLWEEADNPAAGNNDCWITGWGRNYTSYALPTILQEANINVYTQAKCRKKWKNIDNGMICVGDTVDGQGACNGDSGGPLVCKKDGVYKLVGATSWGSGGCKTKHPSVYTRISYYRDWIKDKTGI